MGTFGGQNIWKVSAEERLQHDQQFFQLKPMNGFITGEQARGFFMQSGLPSQLLAQIWNLADLNHDGKMDKKEFSIAMQLIKNKLKGFNIPPTLPDSMKIDPDPMIGTFGPSTMAPVVPLSGIQSAAGGMASIGGLAGIAPVRPMGMPMAIPGMVPGTMGYGGSLGSSPVASVGPLIGNSPQRPASALAKPNIDWSMSQGTKLKFSQMFNNLDKQRVGSITGAHARNIMSSSGLPPTILAQIWNLSDLDKDGKLTCDEFCIAMHLIEMAKAGETNFPATTPLELIPPSRQRTISTASVGSVGDNAGGAGLADLMGGALDDIEQKRAEAMAAVSFEDKRRLNFEKGQMELERRRQMLQEQERREREERERKEREEQEKRDRERMEIERRRQLEREKELARMRELEQQKAEEYQKMMEQREAARRDLERQRQLEWEKQRIQELTAQRQRDQEAVCHLKQKQKNLTFQLQALNEKSAEVNGQITQMRDKIIAITSGIEQMKEGRDRKVADITLLQRQLQEQKTKLLQAIQQKQILSERQKTVPKSENNTIAESYRQVMHSYHNKEMNMETLKQSLLEMEKEQRQNLTTLDEKQKYLNDIKKEMESLRIANLELTSAVSEKQQGARSLLNQKIPDKHLYTTSTPSANGSTWPPETGQPWGGSPEFSATSITTGGFVDDPTWGSSAAQDSGWAADFDRQPSGGSDHVAITATAGHSIVRFKALYEFSARAEDELSFQPGDIIQVFRDYPAQEGWLAGQIHDKVGWFPKDYATELAVDNLEMGAGANTEDPWGGAVAPLDSIREESGTDSSSVVEERQAKPTTLNGAFEAQRATDNSNASALQQVSPTDSVRLRSAKGDDSKVNANRQYAVTEGCLEAKALYPWKAKKEEHLSFNKGDIIKVLEQQEMFWRGELPNGSQGWFPKSYVKLINGPITRRNSSRAQTPTQELDELPDSQRESGVEQTIQLVSENVATSGEPYVAVYSFQAVESGDLGFNTGDVIFVIRKEGDWWTGRLANGTEGIFPANYVQPPMDGPEDNQMNGGAIGAATIPSPSAHSDVVSMTHSGSGHSHENTAAFQYPTANNMSSPAPTTNNQTVGDPTSRPDSRTSGTFANANKISAESVEMGKVIAPFTATASNQINLQPGEMVRITSKSPTGWWEGEIQRQGGQDKLVGWFPGSYVKVVGANKLSSELSRTGSVTSAKSTTRSTVGKNENLLVALFDYVSQQEDELSLSAGDVVSLVEKVDGDWWKGTVVTSTNANGTEGKTGVFPSNYVKPYAGDIDLNVPIQRKISASPISLGDEDNGVEMRRKRNLAIQELIQTEHNYMEDLKMVRQVFFKPLGDSGCLTPAEMKELSANWDELERITKMFCKELKKLNSEDSYDSVGDLVLGKLAQLQGFVAFGEAQQSCLDLLERKERKDPKFRAIYTQCCANPVTRGFKLDYYMHLPIARVTKYPLVIERILKYSINEVTVLGLQSALDGLKGLCAEVNRRATDVENLRMLQWCQTHVKLEGMKPKLLFQSETHSLGLRKFLHSGILYKAKSSRMLVGLLFNDFLMLTIPDNTIDHPDSFKLTRTSDINLSLYRQPLLLSKCSVTAGAQPGVPVPTDSSDECLLSISSKSFSVHLRTVSSNARLLWMKQLEKAIQGCREPKLGRSNSFQLATSPNLSDLSARRMTTAHIGRLGIGRLLIGVSSVERLYIPEDLKDASCYAELSFGSDQIFRTSISDFNAKDLLVTQFLIEKDSQPTLKVGFYLERIFAVDFVVGYVEIPLKELMKEAGFHKGPVERKIPMKHEFNADQPSFVFMKFDVQLFDNAS